MQLSTLFLLFFTTSALPTSIQDDLQPLQIRNLTARTLSDLDFGLLNMTLYDPNTSSAPTICNVNWHPTRPVPTATTVKCYDEVHAVSFPDGLGSHIDHFTLRVQTVNTSAGQTHGEVELDASVAGSHWVCRNATTEFIKEECTYTGIAEVEVER
ncbi:uncharacterized protein BP01DRAFT_367262 [Aspergillus saccharolyticus JOP 1030-1]|uniref:AA1-like domain-containing protein n=1 Tax=Aspergillus saccharolyticus JOP 1030-1 TaxID=1450539 RepID=A0A319A8S0_9EURO|nr:hypothetical protein BP01DRAFT_367262 [Aspergillus saccharolyticus JOP 1030-1]PYH43472.1 hypothetical protein BP01DRAFT_367262 [Aspergillus saccharolyticus JOP 1030-1]